MAVKIIIAVVVILIGFLGYVSTREGTFYYERSGIINAPADRIFPYISNFKMGKLWSPYENKDPNMKREFEGEDGQVGSVMHFDGSSDVGAGKLEMLKIIPNEIVELRLFMTRPMKADHLITYKLTPEEGGTRFTWSMAGDNGFLGKLMTVIIDCDKMIGGQMNEGISNLKVLVESHK